MSDLTHAGKPVHSRLRRAAIWLASKPETIAWIAVAATVMVAMELGEHAFHWW